MGIPTLFEQCLSGGLLTVACELLIYSPCSWGEEASFIKEGVWIDALLDSSFSESMLYKETNEVDGLESCSVMVFSSRLQPSSC